MIKSEKGFVKLNGTAIELVAETIIAVSKVKKKLLEKKYENEYLIYLNNELHKIANIKNLDDLDIYMEK